MAATLALLTLGLFFVAVLVFVLVRHVLDQGSKRAATVPLVAPTWSEVIRRKAPTASSLILKGYHDVGMAHSVVHKTWYPDNGF